ncbi:MAG: DUF2992 family protein [Christensenellales bacterium]
MRQYHRLAFSPAVEIKTKPGTQTQSAAGGSAKQLHSAGIGTKSQQALKLQYEQSKVCTKPINANKGWKKQPAFF